METKVGQKAESVIAPPSSSPTGAILARFTSVFMRLRAQPNEETPLARSPDRELHSGLALTLRLIFSFRFSFLALVALPSLASWIYLAAFASDQYSAEARFALHAAQFDFSEKSDKKDSAVPMGTSGAPALAGQEAYVVASYIRSAAVLQDLPPSSNPREVFRRPEADFWARLKDKASREDLTDYWRSMVTTYVDGPSGVVSVSVRGFRRDDARDLVAAIVSASETLVNKMSERARRDAMRDAEEEVRRTEGLVRDALAAERAFRNERGQLDPGTQATSATTLLLGAMTQKLELDNEYAVATHAMSPEAPTVQSLQARRKALDDQIDHLRAEMTSQSPHAQTISASIAAFEGLELKRLFAEKLYTLAQDALERARLRAERQSVYLSVFVPPQLPEEAEFPQRWSLGLIIAICLATIWGILALAGAAVADHAN